MSDVVPLPADEPLGPSEFRDPFIRQELKRASVWFGLGLAILAVIFLAQPLLLILGGVVFAAMLDGGTRLLGRVLPIGRGWRLLIVTLAALAGLVGTVWLAGVQLSNQAATLRDIVTLQVNRLLEWGAAYGLGLESIQPQQVIDQAMSSLAADLGSRSSCRRPHQPRHDHRHRPVHRRRAQSLWSGGIAWMLRAAKAASAFYRTRNGWLHAAPADGRTAARHGGARDRHLAAA